MVMGSQENCGKVGYGFTDRCVGAKGGQEESAEVIYLELVQNVKIKNSNHQEV